MSEHIVKSFDEELAQLNRAIAEMGELSQSQLSGSMTALMTGNATIAAHVVKADLAVDALERELDARAIKVLALRAPIASDLRGVLGAVKIGAEFERICDYAANISKRAIALNGSAPAPALKDISELSGLALKLLKDVLEAFMTRNAELALAVWAHDEQLDETYTGVYRQLLEFMRRDPQNVGTGAHLLFIAKNIERIGDHATNIAESIHYLVTGEALTGERPKGDKSSFDRVDVQA